MRFERPWLVAPGCAALLLCALGVSFASAQAPAPPAPAPGAPRDPAPAPPAPAAPAPPAASAPAPEAPREQARGEAPAPSEVPAEGAPAESQVPDEGEVQVPAGAAAVDAAPSVGAVPQAPTELEQEPIGEAGEIIVTGSRIKRTSFSLPSAVQVVSRKELEMSGADNLADVVRSMSINSGSELNTDVSTAAGGTAQFNLRGLGLNSTLVLLNGRRIVNSATVSTDGTNFVDINTIPLAAIERIEVLKGGASAIYGSDAVAGVVNIITRKSMDGFEVQFGGQTTDDFDQHEWDVALVGGTSGETTRVNLMVSYLKREPLRAEDRDFTKNGRNVSLLGQPSAFARVNQFGMEGGGLYTDPRCTEARYSQLIFDQLQPLQLCGFNFNPYMMLLMEEQRINTYGTLEQDIGEHVMAFFEAGYAAARSLRSLSPSFPLLNTITVPVDNPYNTTGNDLHWKGRVLGGDYPPSTQFFQSDTLLTVAGLKGDLGAIEVDKVEEWEWELAGTFSRNQFRFGLSDTLLDPLQDALVCEPGEDPTLCLNPFYDGPPNSQELIDMVQGEARVVSDTELRTLTINLSGPLFELPGGDFAFAMGAQLRQETARSDPDHDANQLDYVFLIGGPDYESERQIAATYGELRVPAFDGMELNGAVRLESYDDAGSSVDPMIGLSWTPATSFTGEDPGPAPANVRLRGTFTTSFRAPTLMQMDGAQTEIAETFDVREDAMGNPVRAGRSIYRAVITQGNPDLMPEKSVAVTGGLEWRAVKGFVLELDYFRYDFEDLVVKENHQQSVDNDFDCSVADPSSGCDPDIKRDEQGSPLQIYTSFINAPNVVTDGIDLNASYTTDFGASAGTFSFAGGGSYVLSYDIEVVPGADVLEAAGNRNFANPARPMPRLRLNFPIAWSVGGQSAGVAVHFISGYKNDDPTTVATNPADPTMVAMPMRQRTIDPWVTFDLQYGYRIDEGDGMATSLKIGVINLLDSDPPKLDAAYGYDVFVHDPRGRLLYARLTQEF